MSNHIDLEIKDAELIYKTVWSEIDESFPKPSQCFPKEIIWLGGAPGAGKGTNTPFIQKERGFTCEPVVVSSLLNTPEAQKIKATGAMVGDREVIGLLLKELLKPEYQSGVIVDGFPRTQVQVEFLKMFYNKMVMLKNEFHGTAAGKNFRYPLFRITVLFVKEQISVERQLKRGQEAKEHNSQATEGQEQEEIRETDFDEGLARNRYRVFKEQTYSALASLKNHFHYHFIDAEGDLSEVEWNIAKEFQYQSSLELDHDLFEELRHIPIMKEVTMHSRQDLVKRLEDYYNQDKETFHTITRIIEEDFAPIIHRHAASGFVILNTQNKIFECKNAIAMLIDIFCERGFKAAVDVSEIHIPARINKDTFEIETIKKYSYAIHLRFTVSELRRSVDEN